MASSNVYGTSGVPVIDFSPLGELADVYKKARREGITERTLASLGENPDFGAVSRALLAAGGDKQTALSLAQLGMSAQDRALQQAKFEEEKRQSDPTVIRARTIASESPVARGQLTLAERAASPEHAAAMERAKLTEQQRFAPRNIREVTIGGEKHTIETFPDGRHQVLKVEGMPTEKTNPYAIGGGLKEHEAKSALFADRMAHAHSKITEFEGINKGATGWLGGTISNIAPEGVTRNITGTGKLGGEDRQQVMNAKRSFINALLRRESGAVIQPVEFTNYDREYFPQPGDSDKVIGQKRIQRETVIKGLMREAGQQYKPPAEFISKDQARAKQGAPAAAVPPGAIDALRADKSLAKQFDEKYGPGAAARALGQ